MLARATSRGSTPARWSRTTVRASPTGRCRAPLPANTFAPRYSTLPESSAASVTTRNPSRRLARTSAVRESMTWAAAGTRIAQFPPRPSCSAMRAPTSVAVASTIAIRFGPPPRPRRDQVAQDALRVGAGGDLDLGVLTVVVHFFDEQWVGKDLRRPTDAAVELHDQMVPAARVLDIAERPVHELAAAGDDAHVLAQLLRLFHDMG